MRLEARKYRTVNLKQYCMYEEQEVRALSQR